MKCPECGSEMVRKKGYRYRMKYACENPECRVIGLKGGLKKRGKGNVYELISSKIIYATVM